LIARAAARKKGRYAMIKKASTLRMIDDEFILS
jgi:hypothetical protein